MRDKFHRQMDDIEKRLHKVSLRVLDNFKISAKSLIEPDATGISKMMENDQEVLWETASIQKECLALIALQQPMAVDLRAITSYLRSADDVERMNRSSIHIAEVAKGGLYERDIPEFGKILDLASRVTEQLAGGIEAFHSKDVDKARSVIDGDKVIDSLYGEIFGGLLDKVKRGDAKASLLMFVSRWLERIGDRAVNLSSRAIYIVEGKDVELEAEIGEFKVFPNGQ